MCKIIDVEPRDYHVILDFSHTQLEYLLTYLNNCKATPDPDNENWEKADHYVRKEFFPMMDKLTDEIKEQKR